MKKLIHYNPDEAGKLHCDECGYDLPENQPFTAELIGCRCDRCFADMLTLKDYEATRRMFAIVDWLNKWFGWLGTERGDPRNGSITMKLHDGQAIVKDVKAGEP